MKTHKKTEVGDAEGDQIMTAVEVEQNRRKKEKKKKKKKKEKMACNSEVEEDGKEEAIVDDIEEMEKERKAEKKRKKKEKRDRMLLLDGKETKVEKKKQMDEAVVSGDEGREVEQDKLRSVDNEKKRKREEKETKGDTVAVHEERNVVNGKKEKKRKRKEKETNDDMVVGHEEPGPLNVKKDKKKGKVNIMEAGKADDKEKETKDAMVGGHEEQTKVKDKMEKKKKTEAGKEAERDARKKRKLDKGDVEGKADRKVPKSKKRATDADSSEHVIPQQQPSVSRKKQGLGGRDADSSEHVIPKRRSKKVKFSDEVTVFPPPDDVNESEKNEGKTKVQGKRYSKEEDEKIRESVFNYVESMQLGKEGLNMVLYSRPHPQLKGCWKVIGEALPHRPWTSIYFRAHTLFEQSEKREWTKEEVELLREIYKKKGPDWKSAGAELGKFRIHAKDAFRRYGITDRNKGHWSQEEYQTLFEQVNKDLQMKVFTEKRSKHGMLKDDIGWAAISDKLGTRDNATCCRKWYDQLTSPMVEQKLWADVDDYLLLMELVDLDASCEEEVDWDNILEHRSGDIVRKRWNQMVLHLGEHGNKSFSEQVEVLSNRYCPDLLEIREALDARPVVD